MEELTSFGIWVRRQRKRLDLTQQVLAQQVGCTVGMIKKIEADERHPSRELAERLAAYLHIAPHERQAFIHAARSGIWQVQSTPPQQPAPLPAASNLPIAPTPLLGRSDEVAMVCALLRRTDVRLLTLTGPAGIGKTRLALQAAAELGRDFADGVCFVSLAPISDPTLVASALAQALGLCDESSAPLVERLKGHLRERQTLLLLDNFEQIIGAGLLLAELLAAAPRIKLLVTSRELLRLRGEHEFAMPPLALPNLAHLPPVNELCRCPAIELFAWYARAARHDFAIAKENAAAVAAICVRLDGLPLALELAAARLGLVAPQTLLAQLGQRLDLLAGGPRDLPPRQQTMRRAIDWSYQLLDQDEQALFRHVAVFVGGWTLEAAAAVVRPSNTPTQLLNMFGDLVHKSMVRQLTQADGAPRFTMLELMREYGLEQLAAQGEGQEARQAHASYYLALAEQAEPELQGPDQGRWLHRLEQEHPNLRAALTWVLEQRQADFALRFCSALWRFWMTRSHRCEGIEWIKQALDLEPTARALRAKGLFALGNMVFGHQQPPPQEYLAAALELYRAVGDIAGEARTLTTLGTIALDVIDHEAAYCYYTQSLPLLQQTGDRAGLAIALDNLGRVALGRGDIATAHSYTQQSLAIRQEQGNSSEIAWGLYSVANVLLYGGDTHGAAAYYTQGKELHARLGDMRGVAWSLLGLGRIALLLGDGEGAATNLLASAGMFREADNVVGTAYALSSLGQLASARRQFTLARDYYRQSLELRASLAQQTYMIALFEDVAELASLLMHYETATILYSAAAAARDRYDVRLTLTLHTVYEQRLAALRAHLGDERFDAAWERGRTLPHNEAIRLARLVVDDEVMVVESRSTSIVLGERRPRF